MGVTGSNGKTTTTTLIYEVLKKAKREVVLGGNIGMPLSMLVDKIKENDILLLEISDHQLIDFKDFKTNYSILTNVCPTHLDYHGTYEAYKAVKHKIFDHHTKRDVAIVNHKNQDAYNLSLDIKSEITYFNDEYNFIKDNYIYINKEQLREYTCYVSFT